MGQMPPPEFCPYLKFGPKYFFPGFRKMCIGNTENKQKETIVNGKTNIKKVAQRGKPLIFETIKGGQRRRNRQPAGHFAPTDAEP